MAYPAISQDPKRVGHWQQLETKYTKFQYIKKILVLMYSTINVRNGIQATPRGRRLYRAGVGFELAIKRSQWSMGAIEIRRRRTALRSVMKCFLCFENT